MTTRKRSTKATQPKATDAKATQEAQEAEAKAAQEAQEAEAKAAQDAQEPTPSAETRPDDSDLGEQIDGQSLEPIQGDATQDTDAATAMDGSIQNTPPPPSKDETGAMDGANQEGGKINTAPQDTSLNADIPALFIRTKRKYKSRRRAGFRFNREGMGIALSALTEDQVKAIVSDPALEVESCTFPAEAEETDEPAS